LDLLLNFPDDGISREEYILFVGRAKNSEQIERVRELIIRYRELDSQSRQFLIKSLKEAPIISKGKIKAHPRRESILHTIELNVSYALNFFCFPFYLKRERKNGRERISIAKNHWQYVNDLVRKYHKEFYYIEFNSEKDWFSHYGDLDKKGNIEDALEYYETTSKIPQAIESYKTALAKGMIKGDRVLGVGEYADLRFKEKMLEDFLEMNLEILEKGLKLKRRQYPTLVGPIDILALDSNKRYVVIELKKGKTSDKAVGQLLRYIGYIEKELARGKIVRGMIVSEAADKKLEYAFRASKNKDLKLFQFQFIGKAEEIKI